MNIGIVIQARMGSTRLPGKILKPFHGKKVLLEIILENLHRIKDVKIVIATSTDINNDKLECFLREKNELVYRILDEQAISFAGIQVEKEKEKEAKKIERKTKAKNAVKASEKKVDADKPVDSKSSAGKEAVKTDKKKRTRMEKKDKVEKDIVSVENTPAAVEETPVDTEVMKDNPLLPPVVMETNDEDENLSVGDADTSDAAAQKNQ